MKAIVTLSSSEAKRLVAKGVSVLEMVRNAFEKGMIAIANTSTGAYIYEELTGSRMADKGRFVCGAIYPFGMCGTDPKDLLPPILLDRGKTVELQKGDDCIILTPYVRRMTKDDVFIKSGNMLDPSLKAAIYVGDPKETIRQLLSLIKTRNVNLLVPMTLNKTIPVTIEQAVKACNENIEQIEERSMGMVVKVLPLSGQVFTEIDAIKILTGASATPISMGTVRGDAAVTIILDGPNTSVEAAWRLILEIKGEPPIETNKMLCMDCTYNCPFVGKVGGELPTWVSKFDQNG